MQQRTKSLSDICFTLSQSGDLQHHDNNNKHMVDVREKTTFNVPPPSDLLPILALFVFRKYAAPRHLFASLHDVDVCASVNRWFLISSAWKLACTGAVLALRLKEEIGNCELTSIYMENIQKCTADTSLQVTICKQRLFFFVPTFVAWNLTKLRENFIQRWASAH